MTDEQTWRDLGRGTGKRPDGVQADDVVRVSIAGRDEWDEFTAYQCNWHPNYEYQLLVRTPAEPDVLREALAEAICLTLYGGELSSQTYITPSERAMCYDLADVVDEVKRAKPGLLEMAADRNALRAACEPFVDLRYQRGAYGIIQKAVRDFEPVTVTVTKAQMLTLIKALAATEPTTKEVM